MKTRIVLMLVSGAMVVVSFVISAGSMDPKHVILISLGAVLNGLVLLSFWQENRSHKEMAYRDSLTGLFNRREFDHLLTEVIKRAQKKNGFMSSLIMVDIDLFHDFNARFGHRAGDFVLRQVAGILVDGVHLTDAVCRYGGEEIAVILHDIGKDVAVDIARRLCQAIANSGLGVTISLGVATLNIDANDASGLIEAADMALYRAKQEGRNRVCQAVV